MDQLELLRTLEGLHTVETAAETLHLTRQSALNLLCSLKKQGYVTVSGGGKQKRLYKISMKKQRHRDPGMFDIINKYSPMKVQPWYDHQVHGLYGPEEALVDAIQTKSFRVILASMRLFGHIKDWRKLHRLAKQHDCWQQVGALYDVVRRFVGVRTMTPQFSIPLVKKWHTLTQLKKKNFPEISQKWKVFISFNPQDMEAIA